MAPSGPKDAHCDVEYNDVNRTFQQWHSELNGGLSAYEKERRTRTEVSRYRKTKAERAELPFLRFDKAEVGRMGCMNQGRNSNGAPRPPKHMLDLEDVDGILVDRITFSKSLVTSDYAATVAPVSARTVA